MSPLTGDERAEVVEMLRGDAGFLPATDIGAKAAARLRELADKLEAEPDRGDVFQALSAARSALACGEPLSDQLREVLSRAMNATDPVDAARAAVERDEAREALRELLDLIDSEHRTSVLLPALQALAVRGRAVLPTSEVSGV